MDCGGVGGEGRGGGHAGIGVVHGVDGVGCT